LENIIKTPENKALSDLLFCRNDNTTIYPIKDSNIKSNLKWATVDELLFEEKIVNEEVESNIPILFSRHDNLWNIEDSEGHYIKFPFVVFGLNESYQSISITDQNFKLNGKMENYGYPGMEDEYDERFCFTISQIQRPTADSLPTNIPQRFALFAWKTRYIVTDEQVRSLNPSNLNMMNGGYLKLEEPVETFNNQDMDMELSNEDKDRIALEKLKFATIYTITKNELTNNTPTVIWGVLNSNQFTDL
jgi:hypothetical protein